MKEDLRIKSKTSLEKTGNIETEAWVLFNRNSTPSPTWPQLQNHVQNRVQNHFQNLVQNRVRKKIKKRTLIKNMSFLKITDPL